jgi:L-ascorbate metabolism protein UlaG (beta-lactamase superfamily)
MKPKYVIPMHYNTFDEIKADSNEFCQRINKSILKTKPIVMGIGETVEL